MLATFHTRWRHHVDIFSRIIVVIACEIANTSDIGGFISQKDSYMNLFFINLNKLLNKQSRF